MQSVSASPTLPLGGVGAKVFCFCDLNALPTCNPAPLLTAVAFMFHDPVLSGFLRWNLYREKGVGLNLASSHCSIQSITFLAIITTQGNL